MRTAPSSSPRITRIISADKAGRVLSSANATAIQDSLDQLRAVLKKAGIDDAAAEMQVKEFADKCGYETESYPMPDVPAAKPYGGATTFAEVQAYADAQEASSDLSELTWKFQAVYQNIMADEDMSAAERAAAITQAAADFAEQAQDPEASDTDDGDKSVGIMARVKALFSGADVSRGAFTSVTIEASDTKETHPLPPRATEDESGAFASFKDASGDWRWAATWSNNFYDRDGEVFPESAHKEYEAYVDRTKDTVYIEHDGTKRVGNFPELQLWHIPGSKSGRADMIAYDDGMCLATGTWDEDKTDIAAALSRAKDLGVSHGYTYAPTDVVNGAYRHYRTFEISPLPGKKAANIGTDFTAFAAKEEAPMLTQEKREWLVKTIGPERAEAIEENNRRMRKELSDRGIAFKDFVEALAEGEKDQPTPGAPPPTPAPPTTAQDPDPNADPERRREPAPKQDAQKALYAPGFKSEDGGATWTAIDEKAFGGKKAPPFTKDGEDEPGTEDANGVTKKKKEATEAADAIVTAVKEANAPIVAELKAIRDEFTTKIDAIKTGRDDVIATAWANKQWGRDIKSATDSEGNILTDAEATKAALDKIGGESDSHDPALPYVKDLMALMSSPSGLQQ